MEGKGMGFLSLAILLASLCQNSCSTKPVICPKIHVSKNQIIQTRESLTAGARYLSYNKLEDARQCYKLCCETELCDLAQLQYKNVSGGGVERTCYLFHCGHPSKCSFKPHEHYATIEFAQRQEPQVAEGEAKSKNSQRICPLGVPETRCSVDPCQTAICAADVFATCKPSICGSCRAEFFRDNGRKVDCHIDVNPAGSEEKDIETQTPQRHAGQIENNNKGDMWKVKEKLSPSKNPVDHPVKPTTKTAPKHPVGEAAHHSSVDELSYEELEEKLRKLTPTEKKIPVTDKPTTTEEPTTFHHWREFVDNNPHFPQPTERPTEKETPIDKVTPTEKETSIDKVTPTKKEIPTEKETPIEKETPSEKKTPATKETSTAKEIPIKIKILSTKRTPTIVLTSVEDQHNDNPRVRPPLLDGHLHKNMTDVVVIENNHLRIVENKAVLPLAIFLVIAILLLFLVALRLRIVKSKLKRRPFATDDADYLINGMYL